MTYEEAIKHFKSLQKRYTKEHNGRMCEKVNLALEALEKQMPKKPKDKFTVPYDILAWGICPYCGEGVNSDMKFCSECGQALDWSADEET